MSRDSLRTVLRLRKLKEQQALGAVADMQNKIAQARETVEQRLVEQHRGSDSNEEQQAIMLRAMQLSGLRSVELTEEARAEVERCVVELDEALERWASASARTKSAERLDERRRLEISVAAIRAGQRSLDDLVLLLRANGTELRGDR